MARRVVASVRVVWAVVGVMAGSAGLAGAQAPTDPEVADSMASVVGIVIDGSTGAPLVGASTYIRESDAIAVTDSAGLFYLDGVPPGIQELALFHASWVGHPQPAPFTILEIPGGTTTTIEWVVTYPPEAGSEVLDAEVIEAIPIDPVSVIVRSTASERLRRTGARSSYIGPEEIQAQLHRARDVTDIVRMIPSLTVRPSTSTSSFGEICIEALRASVPIQSRRGADSRCPLMPMVIVDGIPLTDPVRSLRTMSLDAIESVEYLSSIEAGVRYGTGSANGVIRITTRTR